MVVAVGGDGTVHEVANGLLSGSGGRPSAALAALPAGTGNDYARGLGFLTDPAGLARRLAAGTTRCVDVGYLEWSGGHRWFVNILSFGVTGEAARRADSRFKRWRRAGYALAAAEAILSHRDVDLQIELDEAPAVHRRIGALVVANAPWFGSGMRVAPGARPDDGQLDLVSVEGAGRLRLLGLLAGVLGGWHLRGRAVTTRRIRRLRLVWEGSLAAEAEGEPVPVRSPLEVTIRPAALRVAGAGAEVEGRPFSPAPRSPI